MQAGRDLEKVEQPCACRKPATAGLRSARKEVGADDIAVGGMGEGLGRAYG